MTIETVKGKCCGCRTCELVCPTQAISMQKDKYAFEMPVVHATKCIDCGKCSKVCPILNKSEVAHATHLKCGAAYALDAETKFKGSSGGLFGILAKQTLKEGGIVYGAALDENLQLKTQSASTVEELEPLYKSKYLLCDTNKKFPEIKAALESGRKVLYCSSPCQLAALKLYLKKEYSNLFLVEFVCHGVGSQTMLDKSIAYSEKKLRGKIKKVVFRYKVDKVSSHYYCYYYERNGKTYEQKGIHLTFPYYNAFGKRLVCRESCYDCEFASPDRIGDITIGDFHTIAKYNQSIDRFAGVSMFVCNTPKGVALLEQLSKELYVEEMPWDVIVKNNRFSNDEKKPKDWDDFLSLSMTNYSAAVTKYLNPYRDWRYYYYKCPKFIRELGLKLLR